MESFFWCFIKKKKVKINFSNDLIINEDDFRKKKPSFSISKALESILNEDSTKLFLDLTNASLSLSLIILYVWKTNNQCLFDQNPKWQIVRDCRRTPGNNNYNYHKLLPYQNGWDLDDQDNSLYLINNVIRMTNYCKNDITERGYSKTKYVEFNRTRNCAQGKNPLIFKYEPVYSEFLAEFEKCVLEYVLVQFECDEGLYDFDFTQDSNVIRNSLLSKTCFKRSTCNGEFSSGYNYYLLVCHIYFLIEFIVRMISQKFILAFLQDPVSLIEIITTIPFLICISTLDKSDYMVQFFMMWDCLRLFTHSRYCNNIENDITRGSLLIVLNILSFCFTFACFTQFVENHYLYRNDALEAQTSLFTSFFFIMTTASTIGYGSVIQSDVIRICLIFFVPYVTFYTPISCGKLLDIINSKSVYARQNYESIKKIDFVVLIGSVKTNSLVNFLEEFFHQDHGDGITRHCVLMQPVRPNSETEQLIQKQKYNLKYIEGSSLEDRDLRRCQVHKASAVIILSDKFSFDAELEDTNTILQAMFIKQHLFQLKKQGDCDGETRVCMQLLRPESIINYELSKNTEERLNEQIICIESMKLSLLSKSCQCPGLVVLINNLIKSSEDPPYFSDDQKVDPNFSWLREYYSGKQYEIYRVSISQNYADREFNELASEVYTQSGLLLFALEIVVNNRSKGDILMNPGSYKLPRPFSCAKSYQYYGYILASDEDEANQVFQDKAIAPSDEVNPFHSFDSNEKAAIAAEFHRFQDEEEDVHQVDNIDGDWMNMFENQQNPVILSDIIFETLEDKMLAVDHVVICGMVENIRHFVMPLRSNHCKHIIPIVILHEELPTSKQWAQLSQFSQIYFVQGSTLKEKSYDRVNIMYAKVIVVLMTAKCLPKQDEGNVEGEEDDPVDQNQTENDESLLDAKTIFKYNIIKKRNPNVKVVTELINHKNIAYLLDNPLLYHFLSQYQYDQTPVFTAGEVYLSSLMDSLICQAYYNPALDTVLRQLIIGDGKKASSQSDQKVKQQDDDFSHIQTSQLYQIRVPKQYVDRKYSKLFENLTMRRQMIPLALFRTTTVNLRAYSPSNISGEKPQANAPDIQEVFKKINYVVTNPNKDIKIQKDDIVFVLSKQEPGDPDKWDDTMFDEKQINLMQQIEEMQMVPKIKKNLTKEDKMNNLYSTMENQTPANLFEPLDEQFQSEQQCAHPSIGMKRQQQEYDLTLKDLSLKVPSLTDQVIDLNKQLSYRNNTIISDSIRIIHEVLTGQSKEKIFESENKEDQ